MKEMSEELAKIKQSFPVSQAAPQAIINDSTIAKSDTKSETKTESKTESKPSQTSEATKLSRQAEIL